MSCGRSSFSRNIQLLVSAIDHCGENEQWDVCNDVKHRRGTLVRDIESETELVRDEDRHHATIDIDA
jgi:hypothetical protein